MKSFSDRIWDDRHPLNIFLTTDHDVNRQYNGHDWLLNFLGSNKTGKVYTRNKLENNVKCMITILYRIVFITRDKDAIESLAFSLGADEGKISDEYQRKRYFDIIARDTVQQCYDNQSSSTSNHTNIDGTATTTTASLTQLSSSEVDGTHNGDITSTTTTTASHTSRQAPTAITTTIIDGSDLSNDGISPLEMPSTLATTFPFTSPMKNKQNSNHNCDGDGDGNCMSVCSSSCTRSTPFLSPLGQDIKRGRFITTPIGNSPNSKSNRRLLGQFSVDSSSFPVTKTGRRTSDLITVSDKDEEIMIIDPFPEISKRATILPPSDVIGTPWMATTGEVPPTNAPT